MDQTPENPTPYDGPQPPEAAPFGNSEFESSEFEVVGSETDKDARMWGLFCHLSSLSGYVGVPLGHILGPLICWLVKKDEFPFVDDQGKESLNFQISMTIYGCAGIPLLCIPIVNLVVAGALICLAVFVFVMAIVAGLKANEGERYRYPLTLRLIK